MQPVTIPSSLAISVNRNMVLFNFVLVIELPESLCIGILLFQFCFLGMSAELAVVWGGDFA